MSKLDDKLIAARNKYDSYDKRYTDTIKQAFADEGWDKYPSRTAFGTTLMTGQEWLKKVSKYDFGFYQPDKPEIMKILKKASGL